MKSLFAAAVIGIATVVAVLAMGGGVNSGGDETAHAQRVELTDGGAQPAALLAGRWDILMEIILGLIHGEYIDMPAEQFVEVFVVAVLDEGGSAQQGGGIAMSVEGDPPFVNVEGEAQPDGSFFLKGMGTVAGYPDVTVQFEGTIEFPGIIEGTYSMGVNGELPGGVAAVYDVSGEKEEQVTPAPTPSPAPTLPAGQGGLWADNDCDDDNDAVDALISLQNNAGIPYNQHEPCPDLGMPVLAVPAGEPNHIWGDLDCDGDVDAVDALKQLQSVAALPFSQEPGCPEVGEAILIN